MRSFAPKLRVTAAKLYFFLSLDEVKSLIKAKGVLLPLAEAAFLKPFRKHLENVFSRGVLAARQL